MKVNIWEEYRITLQRTEKKIVQNFEKCRAEKEKLINKNLQCVCTVSSKSPLAGEV
jgi:hypothetical protein